MGLLAISCQAAPVAAMHVKIDPLMSPITYCFSFAPNSDLKYTQRQTERKTNKKMDKQKDTQTEK